MTTRIATVSDYMTIAPFSIDSSQSLRDAARRMKEQGIRHLPVLEGGQLRGILSTRDVALAEALGKESLDELSVAEAMTPEPYMVPPSAPLARVVRSMAAHRYGCAVIVEEQRVKGILTTVDALSAFADILERGLPREALPPSQVRAVILAEHEHVRALLDRTEQSARHALSEAAQGTSSQALRDASRHLLTALLSHFDLENQLLAPSLAETSGYGAERSERLLRDHAEQEREVRSIMASTDDPTYPLASLAATVHRLIGRVRDEMEREEATLLGTGLLRDDCIAEDCATG